MSSVNPMHSHGWPVTLDPLSWQSVLDNAVVPFGELTIIAGQSGSGVSAAMRGLASALGDKATLLVVDHPDGPFTRNPWSAADTVLIDAETVLIDCLSDMSPMLSDFHSYASFQAKILGEWRRAANKNAQRLIVGVRTRRALHPDLAAMASRVITCTREAITITMSRHTSKGDIETVEVDLLKTVTVNGKLCVWASDIIPGVKRGVPPTPEQRKEAAAFMARLLPGDKADEAERDDREITKLFYCDEMLQAEPDHS